MVPSLLSSLEITASELCIIDVSEVMVLMIPSQFLVLLWK